MSVLDRAVLAERVMTVERHLARVAARLPASPDALEPASDTSDAVVLHLWQATQIVIDLGMTACVAFALGTPSSYADAFRRLQRADIIPADLAERLVRAAGFRSLVAHAYESLDMRRVHLAASQGPTDLRRFLGDSPRACDEGEESAGVSGAPGQSETATTVDRRSDRDFLALADPKHPAGRGAACST